MRAIYLLVLVLVVSCGGDDFKKIENLGEFRILAAQVDQPEVTPGTTVAVKLFVSDVKAAGRTINGTAIACIDPGIAYGAKVGCDHDPSATTPVAYNIDTTLLAANLYTGFSNTINVTVPNTIFVGRSTRDQYNGVGYIVIFKFTVDGRDLLTFKRVTATNRGSLNLNPVGSDILLSGATINAYPRENEELKATSSMPQTFNYQTSEGLIESRTEKMQVAWYLSEGELNSSKSDVNEAVKYLGKGTTAPSLVVAIVRDERGGVDAVIKKY